MGLQAKSLPPSFLSMFRFDFPPQRNVLSRCVSLMFLSQADKLVTFVYKLNGEEVKVDKAAYPK